LDEHPGYFYLCFKAGEHARLQNWPVKVIPQGYELQKSTDDDHSSPAALAHVAEHQLKAVA
jgi:hypothetical protein